MNNCNFIIPCAKLAEDKYIPHLEASPPPPYFLQKFLQLLHILLFEFLQPFHQFFDVFLHVIFVLMKLFHGFGNSHAAPWISILAMWEVESSAMVWRLTIR